MADLLKYTLTTFFLFLLATSPAFSIERDKAEEYCQKKGYAKALRQTIVLVDENMVAAQTGKEIPQTNLELIRLIRKLADPQKAKSNNTFLPREHLKVYALPRDGTEPRPVFSGCQPFYSEQEEAEVTAGKSKWESMKDTYFGSGTVIEAREYGEAFKRNLGRSLKALGKSPTLNFKPSVDSSFLQSSLISSLQSAPRLVNLHDGLPRIILISNFAPFSIDGLDNPVDARSLGFSMAKQANIDFSRSELYAVQVSGAGQNKLAREFAHAFFLGSGALLSGWSNKSVSNLSTNPHNVRVYQGVINYETTKPPVKVRLSWDRNGTLVNSWIAVSLKSTVSTPMSGAALCDVPEKCSIKSDDSGFAQIWSTDPDEESEYDAQMPFSGLSRFEIEMDGLKAKGKIWDPAVDQVGGQENLPFELTLIKEGVF